MLTFRKLRGLMPRRAGIIANFPATLDRTFSQYLSQLPKFGVTVEGTLTNP